MLQRPPVLFPDVLDWACGYVRTALAARTEAYTSSVTVRDQRPDESAVDTMPTSGRLVTIRDDGGPRLPGVTRVTTLGINVWAKKTKDAKNLALMVAAILEASPGNGAIVAHRGATGPLSVQDPADMGRPHFYLSVDLGVRGSAL